MRGVRCSFTVNAPRAECRFSISRGAQLNLLRADFMRGFNLMPDRDR